MPGRRYRRNALSRSRSGFRAASSRRRSARRSVVSVFRRRRSAFQGRSNRWARYKNVMSLDSLRTKLTYFENIQLDPTADGLSVGAGNPCWQFRVNSLHDPDFSGTGHQPMYHDNYSQIWNKYRVISSKITCTIVQQRIGGVVAGATAGTVGPEVNSSTFRFFISKDESTDIPNNFGPLIEEGGSNVKYRYISPSLTGKLPRLSMTCSPSKLLRVSKNDDSISAQIGFNPDRVGFFTIGCCSADGLVNPPNLVVAVRLDFNVEYYDRKLVQPQN